MYNNGLQDKDLRLLHRKLGLNKNFFLNEILESDLFKIEDKGNRYRIYPLFYCDSIETDGDAFINGTYLIECSKDYEQIFLFITDNPIVFKPFYTVKDGWYGDDRILFVYDLFTLQPLRNYKVSIKEGDVVNTFYTDRVGYVTVQVHQREFEVIL